MRQNLAFVLLICCHLISHAVLASSDWKETQHYLKNLKLHELQNVEVTSVSKKTEKWSTSPAAIHVITDEDIRRSGVTSVPEALRMAPGLNVAKIDGNKWAISSRGLNGRYSAALLVLIDGREVYNPVFSGVVWDTVDLMMEDVERIEVIRGPGATLWGSNAVNGVINIITKATEDTQGGKLAAYGGNIEASGALRYGGKIDDHTQYRVYAKYLHRAAGEDVSGSAMHDDQDIASGGFKLSWQPRAGDQLILDGRYYSSQAGQTFENPTLIPPYYESINDDEVENGGHFMASWIHDYSSTSKHILKAYYNRQNRVFPYMSASVDTIDIDFQHQFNWLQRHDIVWGASYRYHYFESTPGRLISFTDDKLNLHTYSGFIQDDIELVKDRLNLIIGTKIEKAFFSDVQAQPSIRVSWTPDDSQMIWGSISRAVRTPSIIDKSINFRLPTLPPGSSNPPLPFPVQPIVTGNPNIKPEELIAYELGYRIFFNRQISLDLSAFYNDYDNLTTLEANASTPQLQSIPQHIDLPITTTNNLKAESYGIELDASWQIFDNWRLNGYYSFIRMFMHQKTAQSDVSGENGEGKIPEHQFSLRSSVDFLQNLHWDLWLRFVDELPSRDVDAYTTLDTRIAWRPIPALELSLVGQNLIDEGHVEYTAEFVPVIHRNIERSFYFKADWDF